MLKQFLANDIKKDGYSPVVTFLLEHSTNQGTMKAFIVAVMCLVSITFEKNPTDNEGIVQPRESEIENIASTAFTEFFPLEGSIPKILPLTERT